MNPKILTARVLQQQDIWRTTDGNESTQQLPPYDKALGTRKILLVAFILCLLLSLAAFMTGIYSQVAGINCMSQFYGDSEYTGHDCNIFPVPSGNISKTFTLLFTVIIAASTECLGYIHATSLRWALAREGRLVFNSNLRLFSTARTSLGNGWLANTFSTFCLILCYAGASCAIYGVQVLDYGYLSQSSAYLRIYPIGIIGAAAGLFGLCITTSIGWWVGERKDTIRSWNPSPLNTTLACLHHKLLHRSSRRSNSPERLDNVQLSALQYIPALRYIYSCAISISCITLSVAGYLFYITWQGYLFNRGNASYPYRWTFFPTSDALLAPFSNLLAVGYIFDVDSRPGMIWPLLWSFLWQSISTLTFHAIELVVNVRRDETCWRKASKTGAVFSKNALFAAFSNKGSTALFLLKPIGQWLYTLGFYTIADTGVGMNSIPLFVLFVPLGLMALATVITTRHHPKGLLPSTYGHLQTIADLVDDWGKGAEGKLYWGDKGEFMKYYGDGIPVAMLRRAGTAGNKDQVAEIRMSEKYVMS